ncbi:MAG: diphosphomevalonate decarboxylase [Anaerolineae bacterium]|nr:diphosphomevalonate decarboxylase [Anaerolineae bacterium]
MRNDRPPIQKATALAHSNIAFVKYWGHADSALRLPANPTLSVNLSGLDTQTTVEFDAALTSDELIIDGHPATLKAYQRVSTHLDHIRVLAQTGVNARVISRNSFPAGAGLASSASAFAALTLAATAALGLSMSEAQLSALARLGSGSASRSIPAGFVEWVQGQEHHTSYAHSIAPPEHWALCDCIALVDLGHKTVGSTEGHARAQTSPLHGARVADITARLESCKAAILARDLDMLGEIMEADAVMMHAVAMTSRPPIYYWTPATLRVMRAVVEWRAGGLPIYYTIDAGPNVHCLCENKYADEVRQRLEGLAKVNEVRVACPGGGARLIETHLGQKNGTA